MRASPKIFRQEGMLPLFVGIVESVNYKDVNPNNLYSILFKWLGDKTHGYTQTQTARPVDPGITPIPLVGELVLIAPAPNSSSTPWAEFEDFYYISTINIQNQVSSNQKPDSAQTIATVDDEHTASNYNEVSATGVPKKTDEGNETLTQKNGEAKLGNNYVEPDNADRISPLQPYEGDKILQGRFGNSIRFGSSFSKDLSVFSIEPTWKKDSDSKDGMPNIIISCGRAPGIPVDNNSFNNFTVEDPNNDSSMIWLTKGQIIFGFERAVKSTAAMKQEGITTWSDQFAGNQVFINSDRIIMNTKKDEIVMFSEGGIGLASNKSITIDTGNNVRIYADEKIYVGAKNESEPAVKGEKNAKVLENLQKQLANLTAEVTALTNSLITFHSAQGALLTPLVVGAANAAQSGPLGKVTANLSKIKGQVAAISQQIDPTKSESVFVK